MIKKYIQNPDLIILGIARRRLLCFMSDKDYIDLVFRMEFGRKVNWNHPKCFNEKIQWLKINNRNSHQTQMVDKYLVKKIVSQIIGEEYIIPTLKKWNTANEIDFDELPNQYVLKCNHDSGGVYICRDNSIVDKKKVLKKLNSCYKRNGFWYGREWPYKNVKPCIILEPYIEDKATRELRDYKFFCFNGKVKCFKIDFGRFIEHHANYFDREGNLLPFGEVAFYPKFDYELKMPNNLNKMIELAEKIAANEIFIRIDFYEVDNKVYFGEATYFPASGFGRFTSDEYDITLGSWLRLPCDD